MKHYERYCVIEDVVRDWAAVGSCLVVEEASMFHVCLRNDTVINIMIVSLAEKDVLHSMAATSFCGKFDASIPNYTASHSGDRARDYPTTAWRCSGSTIFVLCTFLRSHCCTLSSCFTPRTALHNLFTPSHFALGLVSLYLFSGVPWNFVRGGVQQIQLRTEDRENRDLGAVAP